MKTRELEDGSWRVFFSTEEYNQLLDAAPHQDALIAARLMAHSLRVGTVSEIRLDQFECKETQHGNVWTLRIEPKDTSHDRGRSSRAREVWVSEPLVEDIKMYAGVNDFTESKKLYHVHKRTLQNWIKSTAKNAANATGDEDFLKVSSRDLRQYFAYHMLYRHGVNIGIVCQLGGWQSPQSMLEGLLVPDDILADKLVDVGLLGKGADIF